MILLAEFFELLDFVSNTPLSEHVVLLLSVIYRPLADIFGVSLCMVLFSSIASCEVATVAAAVLTFAATSSGSHSARFFSVTL